MELGRIADDDGLRDVARQIYNLKPKTKEAVRLIRRWRLGTDKLGDAHDLAVRLARALDDYVAAHPSTTEQQIETAMTMCLHAYVAAQSEPAAG